ncbi:hypothetical protein E2320_022354 [Naja naja]|nr:hypothetical protein E2320_022354 [Naja naja]
MGSTEGNNKRIADPTSWPESRPILNDCYKICCTLFDEDVHNFRPILYGCRLPCCNVRQDVLREEWPNNVGSYLEEREMPKRCSLSPVQGTDMRAVPGYTPAASTSLITNLSSGEESAEDCLETTSEYKYGYRPGLLRSESESTEPWDVCRPSTTSINNKFTAFVSDDINDDARSCYDHPGHLQGGVKRYISNEGNVGKECACGVAGCICLMTTEFEDSDDSPYTTDVGYYSCC